jgi:hypothetical protein
LFVRKGSLIKGQDKLLGRLIIGVKELFPLRLLIAP